MLTLNLLSIEQKKEIKTERTNVYIKKTFSAVLIVAIITAVIFLITEPILKNNFDRAVEIANENNNQEFNAKINEVNTLVKFINTIENDNYEFSELLINLIRRTPVNIKVSALDVDKNNKSVSIRGFAETREELLEFESNLEKLIFLKNVKLPIQYLSQKNNINFLINSELDLENFYK